MACARTDGIGSHPKYQLLGALCQIQGYTLHLVSRASLPIRLTPSGHYASERLTRPYSGELPANAVLSQLAPLPGYPGLTSGFGQQETFRPSASGLNWKVSYQLLAPTGRAQLASKSVRTWICPTSAERCKLPVTDPSVKSGARPNPITETPLVVVRSPSETRQSALSSQCPQFRAVRCLEPRRSSDAFRRGDCVGHARNYVAAAHEFQAARPPQSPTRESARGPFPWPNPMS